MTSHWLRRRTAASLVSDTCAVFSLSAVLAAAPLFGLIKPRVPRLRSRPPRLL